MNIQREKFADVQDQGSPLFSVNDLSLSFQTYEEGLREQKLNVVRDLQLTIHKGEIVAVVGASGSGKSLLANAIFGVLPENAEINGSLTYKGEELTRKKQEKLRGKEIALIPQTINALDPLMKAGKQVQSAVNGTAKRVKQQEVFTQVALSQEAANRYPFELSGGMNRRVLSATAMVSGAELIVADEPTPGLDEEALRETINALRQLAAEGKGVMLITHDISAALDIADKIAVFYAGQTIEIANNEDFFGRGENLRHPYTKALWNALPQNEFAPIPGAHPLAGEEFSGCPFAPRCPIASEICTTSMPDEQIINDGMVRCFHA